MADVKLESEQSAWCLQSHVITQFFFQLYPVTVSPQHLILCWGKRGRPSDHDDRKKQQSPQGNKGDNLFFFTYYRRHETFNFPSFCFPLSRSSRNVVRTCLFCQTVSSCPCQYGSWTSSCVACLETKYRNWSSAGAHWRIGATPPVAVSNGCPSAKPWRSRKWSFRERWRGSGLRMLAWEKSWRASVHALLRSRGLREV